MASGDSGVDPRYAAEFQRGYDSDPPPWRLPAVVLLALGCGLVALAVVCAVATALDPTAASEQPEASTLLMARAPGPLLASGVCAVILWAADLRRRRPRVATATLFGTTGVLLLLLALAASQLARLVGLTAQGPVSSGGIPLPDEALATYFQRLQTAAMVMELLPWLILTATGALVAAVALLSWGSPRSRV